MWARMTDAAPVRMAPGSSRRFYSDAPIIMITGAHIKLLIRRGLLRLPVTSSSVMERDPIRRGGLSNREAEALDDSVEEPPQVTMSCCKNVSRASASSASTRLPVTHEGKDAPGMRMARTRKVRHSSPRDFCDHL